MASGTDGSRFGGAPAPDSEPGIAASYSTREVARILGMTPARVREFVRAGLIVPARGMRGDYRFGFRDVVLLRAARGLSDRLPPRKVKHALRCLRAQLPGDRALTEVQILTDGGEVVVRDRGALWEPVSKQTRLDFEAGIDAVPIAARVTTRNARTADDWSDAGVELEPTSAEQAEAAYRHAVELAPDHFAACVNLGRLLHARGELYEAVRFYERATRRDGDGTADFNLGVVLEDLGENDASMRAYERAITLDPECADAHYNAARICEQTGNRLAAFRHLLRYRALTHHR